MAGERPHRYAVDFSDDPRLLAAKERTRIAEEQRGEILSAYQRLKTDNEGLRDGITAAFDKRYGETHERLLLGSVRILLGLHKAIDLARRTSEPPALIEGLLLVLNMLGRVLEEEGLELIPVLGRPYDPRVSSFGGTRTVDDPAQHGLVVEQLQPGVRIGGHVAQSSEVMVGVYREPPPKPLPETGAPPLAPETTPLEPTVVMPAATGLPTAAPPTAPPPPPAVAELAVAPEPLVAPEPVVPAEPATAPEPVIAAKPAPIAAEPMVAAEPIAAGEPVVALEPQAATVDVAAPPTAAESIAMPLEPAPETPRARPRLALGLAATLIAGAVGIVVLAWRYGRAPTAPSTTVERLATPGRAPATPAASQAPAMPAAPEAVPAPLPAPPAATPRAALNPRQPEPRRPPVPLPAMPDEPPAAPAAGLVAQAQAAASEGKWDGAVSLYDQALALDPQNEAASAGRSRAMAARDLARRRFVAARTTAETTGAGHGLSGFETDDVNLKKAPRDSAAIEFDTTPSSPQPGEPYSVRIYVANLGVKPLKIAAMTMVVAADAERTGSSVPARMKEIDRGERTLVHELTGAWREGTSSWGLTVTILTKRGDTFRSSLTWR